MSLLSSAWDIPKNYDWTPALEIGIMGGIHDHRSAVLFRYGSGGGNTPVAIENDPFTLVREGWGHMKRFGLAALAGLLALALCALGTVLRSQSNFSSNYVRSQLEAQRINFLPLETLASDQKNARCLVENAGKQLLTGAQAECYANHQIAPDLGLVAGGKTYSEMSYPAKLARDKVIAATAADPSDPAIPKLAADASRLEAPALTLFRGEALRGMLLTTFGFNRLGQLGFQTANVLFVLAGALLLAGVVRSIVPIRVNSTSKSIAQSSDDHLVESGNVEPALRS